MKKYFLIVLALFTLSVFNASSQVSHNIGIGAGAMTAINWQNYFPETGNDNDALMTTWGVPISADLIYEARFSTQNPNLKTSIMVDAKYSILEYAEGSGNFIWPENELDDVVQSIIGTAYLGFVRGKGRVKYSMFPVGLGAEYLSGGVNPGVKFCYSARAQLSLYLTGRFGIFGALCYKFNLGELSTDAYKKITYNGHGVFASFGLTFSL